MKGPQVKIVATCDGCDFANYDFFTGGSTGWSHNRRCKHPVILEANEPVSNKEYTTPSWCPLLVENVTKCYRKLLPEELTQAETFQDKEFIGVKCSL